MRGPRVIERIALGEARTADGRHYGVIACRHDREWPGTESAVTFAVEEYQHRNGCYGIVQAWGFFVEADAWNFIASDRMIVITVYDLRGETTTEYRRGLGLGDGAVRVGAAVIDTPHTT